MTIKEIFNKDYRPVQRNLKMHPRQAHKHTSFYHSSLYRTWQILWSLQTEGLWQPCVENVHCTILPTAFSHFMSLCHSWVTCRISIFFFSIIISVVVIYDQWIFNIAIVLFWRIHIRRWTLSINVVCVRTAPPNDHSSISLSPHSPPYFLKHNTIEPRPVNNLARASKC